MKWDTKIVIWVITVVFIAGGGWWSLKSVSENVSNIQDTLDEQGNSLTIHLSSDAHPSGAERISRIEDSHTEMGNDIKQLMTNQSAICQATGARCR